MTFLIVLGIYIGLAAAVFYVAGRRFGLPSLALAAGAVLAELWAVPIAQFIASEGVVIEKPPLGSVAAVIITLLAGLSVMLRAPKVDGRVIRIVSSVAFGVLLAALTYQWFKAGVVLDEASVEYVAELEGSLSLITSILLIAAILDVALKHKQSLKTKK